MEQDKKRFEPSEEDKNICKNCDQIFFHCECESVKLVEQEPKEEQIKEHIENYLNKTCSELASKEKRSEVASDFKAGFKLAEGIWQSKYLKLAEENKALGEKCNEVIRKNIRLGGENEKLKSESLEVIFNLPYTEKLSLRDKYYKLSEQADPRSDEYFRLIRTANAIDWLIESITNYANANQFCQNNKIGQPGENVVNILMQELSILKGFSKIDSKSAIYYMKKFEELSQENERLKGKVKEEDIFLFGIYLTGHDHDTIYQMYNDWLRSKENGI